MEYFSRYGKTIDILAKFSIIIMLLFICYKNLTFQHEISGLVSYLNQQEGHAESLPEEAFPDPVLDPVLEPFTSVIIYRVYITGAVSNPGLYDIEYGKRIADLIELAGGAAKGADLESINLAAYVEDARHVHIPFSAEEKTEDVPVFNDSAVYEDDGLLSDGATHSLININTADMSKLMSLPGIGETLAGRIIDYRRLNGGFKFKEEIKNVNRIGDGIYENIKDMITV